MEILQEIGAYAGLAAIVGLALLSALYFSQARDVRRLREWAGRAPERTSEPAAQAPRVTSAPTPATGTANVRPAPAPAAVRATAQTAAAGAGGAVASGPPAATPAATRVVDAPLEPREGGAGESNGVSQDTMAHPPPRSPNTEDHELLDEDEDEGEFEDEDGEFEHDDPVDEDRPIEDDEDDDGYEDEDDLDLHEETDDRPVIPASPAPRRPVPPVPLTATGARPVPGATTTAGGSILPPYERSRPGGDPWYRRVFYSPGRAALVITATVLVLAAATLGGLQLAGGDGGADKTPANATEGSSSSTPGAAGSGEGAQPKPQLAVDPGSVTVAVLNGTTVQGAAQGIGDTVEGEGYQLGTVSNFTDQTRAESVVLYAPGAEREASDVMRRLKIGQREPIDPDSQTAAGDASVVVVVGADQAN